MAVLAPVLERKLNTEEKTAEARNTALMNEENLIPKKKRRRRAILRL